MSKAHSQVLLCGDVADILAALDMALRGAPGVTEQYLAGYCAALAAAAKALHADYAAAAVEEMLAGVEVGR